MTRRPRTLALAAAVALLAAAPAAATTYVLPPDEALVAAAEVVAQVTVAAVEPAPVDDPPATDVFVQIERVLKGFVAGGTVVVRVPGGIGPDGVGLKIWGAPEFAEGERALVFLAPRSDGTYGILHLALGAFYEVESGGRRVAARALSEVLEVSGEAAGEPLDGVEPLRDFDRFADWIAARAAGDAPAVDYLLAPPRRPLRALVDRGPLLEDRCTGRGFRWSQLDRGEAVTWRLDLGGPIAGAGRRAFDRARRAWNRASRGQVRLRPAGSLALGGGLVRFDEINSVALRDRGETVTGAFACGAGGVLSVTGLWFDNGRGQACQPARAARSTAAAGRDWLEILGADIVLNDGAACLVARNAGAAARILAHELGHGLGLGHARSPSGVMWGEARGADGGPLVDAEAQELVLRLYRRPERPGG